MFCALTRTALGNAGSRRQGSSLATPAFQRLVQSLKETKQTCALVESSCGGLIAASLMAVPGSSRVYYGSTVAYNTKLSGPLLCGDRQLHERLMKLTGSEEDVLGSTVDADENLSDEATQYIRKKIASTRAIAVAYCKHMDTDLVIVEGGATGPTFTPKDLTTGFAVLAVAGRQTENSEPELLAQTIVYSDTADREANMRLYADSAADLCSEVLSRKPSDASMHRVDNTAKIEKYQDYFDRSSHLKSDESAMNEM